MSRSLLHGWECAIDKCCREDNSTGMISIAKDIYNTAYARGKNSIDAEEVLDKIRAEIEQIEINGHIRDVECFSAGINAALAIIDKYKAGK